MNFYLADVQIKRLKRISQRMGLSVSEILRRAIDEYWEEVQKKKKRK
jgi:predicted DNA-binding protein